MMDYDDREEDYDSDYEMSQSVTPVRAMRPTLVQPTQQISKPPTQSAPKPVTKRPTSQQVLSLPVNILCCQLSNFQMVTP